MSPETNKPDKYLLYQSSVQNPVYEVNFMRRVYRKTRGRSPLLLREDFCGTAVLACEWVRMVRGGRAVGVDLDENTLQWAAENNIAQLGSKAERLELACCDVLTAENYESDIVAAFNFSYCVFKEREILLSYFRKVHETLNSTGIFFLDLYGGPDAQVIQEESREVDEEGLCFRYVWDQARYNPVTGETVCHIHFDLPGGNRIERAFSYDWRLWNLPELKDLLREAGFEKIDVYWEGTDHSTGEGNGAFRLSRKGDDSRSWICYLVATR